MSYPQKDIESWNDESIVMRSTISHVLAVKAQVCRLKRHTICESGGIGIRSGLKIRWAKAREGSSPFSRINY